MAKQSIYVLFITVLVMVSGCTDDNKAQKQAEEEEEIRGAIVKMLSVADGKMLNFIPSDTILELDNETELVLWKKSFLNQDSTVYTGKVQLNYYFTSDPKNILFQQYDTRHSALEEIMGVIQFTATDDKSNDLVLNPQYSTVLRFHPKLKMLATTYFQYDSIMQKYSTPAYFYEKKVVEKIAVSNQEIRDDIEIDDDFRSSNNTKKQKYQRQSLTKSEIIGYEMTLKNMGLYYISRENKKQNLQTVAINISAQSRDALDWKKVKAFLFTNQNDYNYYLRAKNLGDGNFKIIPASEYKELKLPLEGNYTLLLWGIDGDKSYFSKRDVKLESVNNLNFNLKNVKFDRLLKEIKSL